MEIVIRGDKIKITDAMKNHIEEKINKLNKYLDNGVDIRANVVIRIRNHSQIAEITIPLKSFILRSEEEHEDVYAAIDKAVDKLERQIRKNKTKLLSRQNKIKEFVFNEDIEEEQDSSKVMKRKKVDVKPMDEEEAIIQMELINHQFYMYKDSETNKPCVVYKRKDGGYGVIESE